MLFRSGTNAWDDLLHEPEPLRALADYLAEARRVSGAPVIVCAAYTPRWVEIAAALAQRFPTTVFMFWTGDALPPEDGPDSAALRPSWPGGEDRRWRRAYRVKLKHLGGANA